MTRQPLLLGLGITIGLLLLAALGLAVLGAIANHRARQLGPDHPGVTTTTPTLLPKPVPFPVFEPATPPARPVGRHHEDTVHRVPDDWMPITGADRIRALEETRQFTQPDLSPRRKEGGS